LTKYFESATTNKRVLSVDIDGTIANISNRIRLAESRAAVGSPQYWDIALSGENYHLDSPIMESIPFLHSYLRRSPDCEIVYLSGRRTGTESYTRAWLDQHGFPPGRIIHRSKGTRSFFFKLNHLREMKGRYSRVDGHIGDRLEDDGGAAKTANVDFYHIIENEGKSWLEIEKNFRF
jgi:hypothetical protein